MILTIGIIGYIILTVMAISHAVNMGAFLLYYKKRPKLTMTRKIVGWILFGWLFVILHFIWVIVVALMLTIDTIFDLEIVT